VLFGGYDVVILDELNNALAIEKFPIDDVLPLVGSLAD
jgi:cob(I)alamin adenosyltransferase